MFYRKKSAALRQAIINSAAAVTFACLAMPVIAQPAVDDQSTVTYPAEFFAQYEPFSVNDMLNRIPGISLALDNGGGGGGGSGRGGGGNNTERRGLGSGGDQILINGRRMAGKENEGSSQLSRIPANQVQYIEIIRGTSGDLAVRGGGQIINIVLLESQSRSTTAVEVNTDRYHDGTVQPGGAISYSGQSGDFNYLFSAQSEPRYEFRDGFETSINGDFSPNDIVVRQEYREQAANTLNTNLGYNLTPSDRIQFNALYSTQDPEGTAGRIITDLNTTPAVVSVEYDEIPGSSENWELGGDYEHIFLNGSMYKFLFIVNQADNASTREAFAINGGARTKKLYLDNTSRNRERIARTSYNFSLADSQDMEIGIERAQTILDAQLKLGVLTATGQSSSEFGGLTPITNTDATVEEIRYEAFAVHNWQINPRMTLESTLLFEQSTIEQSGDVSNKRDFDFVRPKLDYRFNITPALQFRAVIEKDVSQLSFADFTASSSAGDDDQNAMAGNPDLRQEQSWRYEANLELRLPQDAGVLNSRIYYHDLEDVIERVDVSTGTRIQSANGNIGDGERYGLALDASLRMGFINLPEVLVTLGLQLEDSSVTDPFLGIDRRLRQAGRGSYRVGLRHDIPNLSLNYGFNFGHGVQGNRKLYDIDKIEDYTQGDSLSVFVEKVGFAGFTYRFEATNILEGERCRVRSRYTGGTIANGTLAEIEDSCSNTGVKLALKVRGTF